MADDDSTKNSTSFGYRQVSDKEKTELVGKVFSSVAGRYDLMNDLMSVGIHRLWKRFAIAQLGLRKGHRVLDLAGGTGDLTLQIKRQLGDDGYVCLADINAEMLAAGRDRLLNAGMVGGISCIQSDAEQLPFPDGSFDRIIIAFGLRNLTDKQKGLRAMYRALKVGGRVLVLEFSKLVLPVLAQAYDRYSFRIIPLIGDLVADDRESYEYLVESIRVHPDQETLQQMMCDAGFERVDYYNLTAGMVALHSGYKL